MKYVMFQSVGMASYVREKVTDHSHHIPVGYNVKFGS